MKININLPALYTNRMYQRNVNSTAKTLERLSSGRRINHASDDAAGFAISDKMHRNLRGLKQASRNTSDNISFIRTFEGAMDEIHSMLQRMRELSVQGASDSNKNEDRMMMAEEMIELSDQINKITEQTQFNDIYLLKGDEIEYVDKDGNDQTTDELFFQIGGEEETVLPINLSEYKTTTEELGIPQYDTSTGEFVVNDPTGANPLVSDADITAKIPNFATMTAEEQYEVRGREWMNASISAFDGAINDVSYKRAKLGAIQNRLESTQKSLDNSHENVMEARSRIQDVDIASEYSEYVKNSILHQASTSMLGHANQMPQAVLQLLNRA